MTTYNDDYKEGLLHNTFEIFLTIHRMVEKEQIPLRRVRKLLDDIWELVNSATSGHSPNPADVQLEKLRKILLVPPNERKEAILLVTDRGVRYGLSRAMNTLAREKHSLRTLLTCPYEQLAKLLHLTKKATITYASVVNLVEDEWGLRLGMTDEEVDRLFEKLRVNETVSNPFFV